MSKPKRRRTKNVGAARKLTRSQYSSGAAAETAEQCSRSPKSKIKNVGEMALLGCHENGIGEVVIFARSYCQNMFLLQRFKHFCMDLRLSSTKCKVSITHLRNMVIGLRSHFKLLLPYAAMARRCQRPHSTLQVPFAQASDFPVNLAFVKNLIDGTIATTLSRHLASTELDLVLARTSARIVLALVLLPRHIATALTSTTTLVHEADRSCHKEPPRKT